ncbi:thioredoxin trx1 [Coemansia furcata]|nr:thioredoxin trx1 [Coemansia furcata]
MPVVYVENSDQFYRLINSSQKVVVDFTASWCGPCRQMAPVFHDLSGEYSDVLFLTVDIDKVGDVARYYSVSSLPTFKFFYSRHVYNTVIGANRPALEYGVQTL